MTLSQTPNVIWIGLCLGAGYAIVALGWVLIYRATKVLNFATAEMFVLGAFLLYWTNQQLGINFYLAALISVVLAAVISGAIYAVLIRPLAGSDPFPTVVITLGIALVLDSVMTWIWGGTPLQLTLPFSSNSTDILGVPVSITQAAMVGATVLVTIIVSAALRWTSQGIQMRAVAERPLLASQSGINIVLTGVGVWAVTGAILALGGMVYAAGNTVSENSETIALQALAAAFIGGLDSVPGALLGGLLLGVVEAIVTQYTSGAVGDAVLFGLLLVFILIRPTGLLGTLEARRV